MLKQVLHYPRLDTILRVENLIHKGDILNRNENKKSKSAQVEGYLAM
jgi:hypothetical protein